MLPINAGPLVRACVLARTRADGHHAAMLQRRGDELVLIACDGLALPPVHLPLDPTRSAAARTLALRGPMFVPETRRESDISHGMIRVTGARSLLLAPMVDRVRAHGVLIVGWCTPIPQPTPDLIHELEQIARDVTWALPALDGEERDRRQRRSAAARRRATSSAERLHLPPGVGRPA